ncbi:MAG: DUF1501 domain-containing protein, partial [Planctomycetaceae bacterium]|nr:DUF1501 domain-containing protein [Planctomycetaceae bacterium]
MASVSRPAACAGPMPRREFMKIGALSFGGVTMGLSDILSARAASDQAGADTSVIMLYQHGGASQLETWDLKPDAPSTYRSVYRPIPTVVPGMDICEHFPLQAKLADRFSLVRSLHHDVGIHSDGGIVVLTGKRPTKLDPSSTSKSEHPDFGSVVSHLRGMGPNAIPPYVSIPQHPYMTRPTYLGMHHSSFVVNDPSQDNYRPPQLEMRVGRDANRLDDRRTLLTQLDRLRSDLGENLAGVDQFRDLAFQMLTSPTAAKAFLIDQEAPQLREKYGHNMWGQSCLLARRLAEAGTGVVHVYFNTPKNGPEFTNWDDHISNAGRPGHFAKYMDIRLPYMDQAVSALIEDIWQRGLNKRILVVVVGEFGRTPRISSNSTGAGRDHWPQ